MFLGDCLCVDVFLAASRGELAWIVAHGFGLWRGANGPMCVRVSQYEIERLTRELQDMKRKYYEQKRREQLARDAQRGDLQESDPLVKQQQQFHSTQPRFVGGGFALSTGGAV